MAYDEGKVRKILEMKNLDKDVVDVILKIASLYNIHPSYIQAQKSEGKIVFSLNYHYYIAKAIQANELEYFKIVRKEKEDGDIIAKCIIKRKSMHKPFSIELALSEVKRNNKIWSERPTTMLYKTIIASAFKWCFADLYEEENLISSLASAYPKKIDNTETQQKFYQNKNYQQQTAVKQQSTDKPQTAVKQQSADQSNNWLSKVVNEHKVDQEAAKILWDYVVKKYQLNLGPAIYQKIGEIMKNLPLEGRSEIIKSKLGNHP
jgi:hypothetical protein